MVLGPVEVPICLIDRSDGAGDDAVALALSDLMRAHPVQRVLPDGLGEVRTDTRALFVRAAYFGDLEDLVERLPELAWIHVAIAGTEHLPRELLGGRNIALTNSAGVLDRAIGEFVAASVLMWSKGLLRSARDTPQEVTSHREPISNDEVRALIVGAGGIGKASAKVLRSIGVGHIAGVRRNLDVTAGDFDEMITPDRLLERISDFNVVVASLPGMPQTAKLIDADVLEAMAHPSVFVNVGRGSTVDHEALTKMLVRHSESVAVLDVTDPEPLPSGHALWNLPNLVVSPHMAGDTSTRHDRYARLFRENVDRFIHGHDLLNRVL